VQLTGAGFNVLGMGFAGIPGVLIGANDHLAWTSTSGSSHNEDVFVEKLQPDDEHRYLYHGTYQPMQHRVERILVKDKPALDYDVYRTIHGPVIAWSPGKDVAYAKQMAYFGKEFSTAEAFLKLNTAQRIQDIPPLAAKIVSSHNIIVATQEGDIGFWHCGYFPIYPKGVDPRLPLRGSGEDDWQGFVPFSKLPQVVNPPGGIIFNWNNKPAPDWRNYGVPSWGVAFHISNIRYVLERELREHGGKLSLTDIERVAPEIGRRNYIADWLKPGLLEAAARAGAKLGPDVRYAVDYLRHWDNQLADGSVAQTIFEAWYQHLRQDIFAETLGDLGGKNVFDQFVNSSTVYHALAGPESSVRLSRNYLGKRSPDEVRLKALDEALGQLRQERGADMSFWEYRTDWIKFDPLPSIPWYSRGTYIQAVVLSKPQVHGVYILPPGQSEDPHSPHYSDQLSLAGWWMFVPMELKREPPIGGTSEPEKKP
jgi:penicillin amidase